jgi:threonylcarbamoyladenosine tRNA methylthiotransferase MtaB
MRRRAAEAGLGEAVIINTCAVTGEAERQARQAIRKARRENPGALIIVTGCAANINPEQFEAMPEVDRVVGNAAKMMPETFTSLRDGKPLSCGGDISGLHAAVPVPGFEGRSRAFVQVQNGCDHRCTFCVIPYGRGPSRSFPADLVIRQAAELVGNGYAEISLTGVDIASYGTDLPGRPGLGAIVRRLLDAVPRLGRLRLSSLDPAAPASKPAIGGRHGAEAHETPSFARGRF